MKNHQHHSGDKITPENKMNHRKIMMQDFEKIFFITLIPSVTITPTIAIVNNKNIYAWKEEGKVVLMNQNGKKKVLGKDSQPVLKALDKDHLIWIWENEKHFHAAAVEL